MSSEAQHCTGIPSIFSLPSTIIRFTCIEPETKKLRRCGNPINKVTAVAQAVKLRNDISELSPSCSRIPSMLEKLAKLLYCAAHKRLPKFKNSLKLVVNSWHAELKKAFLKDQEPDSTNDLDHNLMHPECSDGDNEGILEEGCLYTNAESEESQINSFAGDVMQPRTPRPRIAKRSCSSPSRYTERFPPKCTSSGSATTEAFTASVSDSRDASHALTPEFKSHSTPTTEDPFTDNETSCPSHLKNILLTDIDLSAPGYLYIFTREANPDHVKIGYTKYPAKHRLKQWQTRCNYLPRLRYQTQKVPWARRLEKIVHSHLVWKRKTELQCKHNVSCKIQHNEWFEMSVEEAVDVVKRWESWMLKENPYRLKDNKMQLHEDWYWRLIRPDSLTGTINNADAERLPWHHAALLQREHRTKTPSTSPVRAVPFNPSAPTRDAHTIRSHSSPPSPYPLRATETANASTATSSSTLSTIPLFRGGDTPFNYPSPPSSPSPPSRTRIMATEDSTTVTVTLHSRSHPGFESPISLLPLYIIALPVLVMYTRFSFLALEWCV